MSSFSIASKPEVALVRLTPEAGDPIARSLAWLFGKRVPLFFALQVLLGLLLSIFVVPATWGRLQPTAHFNFALYEANAAFVWTLLSPYVGVAYLLQLNNIPDLFEALYFNGVTSTTKNDYIAFIGESNRLYSRRLWFMLFALISLPLWLTYIHAVLSVPDVATGSRNNIVWAIYFAIQYVQVLCLICYLFRHAVAWFRLRELLKHKHLAPQNLLTHFDGLGGFEPVTRFVSATFLVSASVLFIFFLRFLNSNTVIPHFEADLGVVGYIFVGVVYFTVVPVLVFHPLRLAFVVIQEVRKQLLQDLQSVTSTQIARLFDALSLLDKNSNDSSILRELGEVVAARDRLHRTITALPNFVFDIRVRPLLVTFLASVVPVLVGFGIQSVLVVIAPFVQSAIQSIGNLIP